MAIKCKKKTKTLFDELNEGLQGAIKLESGKNLPRSRIIAIAIRPVKKRSPTQIKALRTKLGMTQSLFAKVIGVSVKAVESWEAGAKNPSGPVLRIFEILEKESTVLQRVGIFNRDIA